MIDLSHAMQTILNAYWDDAALESNTSHALAAALRAVVNELGFSPVPEEFCPGCGNIVEANDLLDIATELESI